VWPRLETVPEAVCVAELIVLRSCCPALLTAPPSEELTVETVLARPAVVPLTVPPAVEPPLATTPLTVPVVDWTVPPTPVGAGPVLPQGAEHDGGGGGGEDPTGVAVGAVVVGPVGAVG
jgi:hypothetical protein